MKRRSRAAAGTLLLAAAMFFGPGPAAIARGAGARAPGEVPPSAAQDVPKPAVPRRLDENVQRNYFTDLPLLDQGGKTVRFYTDILKGRVVLVSFIYTNCTDICPILMHNLVDVQERLGDRFGKDVFFVSISVDPEDDTPEELKKYALRYEAKPGWIFLTGKKENVERVIYKLGQYVRDFEEHSTTFLLGDVPNARWSKLKGDSAPGAIVLKVRELLWKRDAGADPAGRLRNGTSQDVPVPREFRGSHQRPGSDECGQSTRNRGFPFNALSKVRVAATPAFSFCRASR